MNFSDILEHVNLVIKNSGRVEYYPFRDRYQHTLRVIKWAERIQKEEGGDLEVIRIACAFHDTGWDQEIDHNLLSRPIAENYLTKHKYNSEKMEKVLEAVENHNQRDSKKELRIESYIVMDADILDELGATTILWDSMAAMYKGEANYRVVYERIMMYLERLNHPERLKTNTGKRFFHERINVIADFVKELEYELF